MRTLRDHFPDIVAYAAAPLVGVAFVWGGYWIPPLELRAALSGPAILAIGTLVWRRTRQIDPSLLLPRLKATGVVIAAWLALAISPYLLRSCLLHHEASGLPAWKQRKPYYRFMVIANNQEDYEGLQLATIPFDQVEAFYRSGMEARGWRFERRSMSYGAVYLLFAKGHRKVAYHLEPHWDGKGTVVTTFGVSFWRGAEKPGTGRRAWYRWVREINESFR